jgi:dTDP-4-dehydrorhamnose 3,5-epimerase
VDVRATQLPEIYILTPRIFSDSRGFVLESFNKRDFHAAGISSEFVQDNHSRSHKGVLRGLHYQLRNPQGKLVSVARGEIFDVVVDVRRGSPTFGKWAGFTLNDITRCALWIPPGFAHGFYTLSDHADVCYKFTEYYDPETERGIAWNDPTLLITWPITELFMSERDRRHPLLSAVGDQVPVYSTDLTAKNIVHG